MSKEKVNRLIQIGIEAGGRLILDGRHIEITGPVLLCMQIGSLEEAIAIVNRNRFIRSGFGASIFTKNGASARKFQTEIEVGQVDVNVPVPAPLPFFAFTGTEACFSGDQNFHSEFTGHWLCWIDP
ncbi:putative methylmalonate-semialdehyde dehydrogenase (CoA acylating) [Helianthus anomalus]